ncbi:SDR family NAD(P)-dependent oxidoreductase [Kytococcus schroeteri]|uniref:SDR family NAD(P)-dependent oxidoreductase n=1 Tax=Kytococcus schroeteri TaxID=138300 RepID=UPI0035E4FB5F
MAERRSALVVGASRGIGAHLARGFAAAGWDLALTARDAGDLAVVADDCHAHGATVSCHVLEVTDAEAVDEVVAASWQEHAGLDAALVVAGVIETEAPLWEVDVEELWRVIEVNVRGPLLVAHALAPRMLEAGCGRVVMLNSGSGTRNSGTYAAYGASKSALSRITGGLHEAGAERGLRAFDLAPGVVRTDMTASMPMHDDRTDWTEPAEVVELALALADGRLDAWSGRMVRAGADTVETLRQVTPSGPARTLGLRSYGPADPLA